MLLIRARLSKAKVSTPSEHGQPKKAFSCSDWTWRQQGLLERNSGKMQSSGRARKQFQGLFCFADRPPLTGLPDQHKKLLMTKCWGAIMIRFYRAPSKGQQGMK